MTTRPHTCKRLCRTGFISQSFTELTPAGVTVEDATKTGYWVNVLPELRVFDTINLVSQSGDFDVLLRIVRLTNGYIEFRLIWEWRPPLDEAIGDRFEVAWAGPKARWFVREISTGKKMVEGLDCKPTALAELRRLAGTKEAA